MESVTLTTQQIPAHNHAWMASTGRGSSNSPVNNVVGSPPVTKLTEPGRPATP